MKEIRGNLFGYLGRAGVICITTNGFVKADGRAVMGRGCAAQAAEMWPSLPQILGSGLRQHGNIPLQLHQELGTLVVSFPVKGVSAVVVSKDMVVAHKRQSIQIGSMAPGWMLKADVDIIAQSAMYLRQAADANGWQSIVIPRPGCGAGELQWSSVRGVLADILDDRFASITF